MRNVVASIIFAVAAALIVALVIVVLVGCHAPPPQSDVRALVALPERLLDSAWHERALARAYAQPTPGCYGRGPVWCACAFVCGHRPGRLWQPTAAECRC